MTKGEIVSTLRNYLKEVRSDSAYSNRYLWSIWYPIYTTLIKRDADSRKLFSQSQWKTYCLELESVSPILCNCIDIPTDCEFNISRTKCKIPPLLDSSLGPIYRFISTVDNSKQFVFSSPQLYNTKSKIRFNKQKYTFFHDNYLWFPNADYPFIIISGIFNEDSPEYAEFLKCAKQSGSTSTSAACEGKLGESVSGPDYLIYPAIQMALQLILPSKNIQPDEHPNTNTNQNTISQP